MENTNAVNPASISNIDFQAAASKLESLLALKENQEKEISSLVTEANLLEKQLIDDFGANYRDVITSAAQTVTAFNVALQN